MVENIEKVNHFNLTAWDLATPLGYHTSCFSWLWTQTISIFFWSCVISKGDEIYLCFPVRGLWDNHYFYDPTTDAAPTLSWMHPHQPVILSSQFLPYPQNLVSSYGLLLLEVPATRMQNNRTEAYDMEFPAMLCTFSVSTYLMSYQGTTLRALGFCPPWQWWKHHS